MLIEIRKFDKDSNASCLVSRRKINKLETLEQMLNLLKEEDIIPKSSDIDEYELADADNLVYIFREIDGELKEIAFIQILERQ